MKPFFKLILLGIFAVLSPSWAGAAEKPTLRDLTVTPPVNGAATANVTATSGGAETTVTFRYSSAKVRARTVTVSPKLTAAEPSKAVSVNLTGLVGGQMYQFTAHATNSEGDAVPLTVQREVPAFAPTLTALAPTKLHRKDPASAPPPPTADEFGTLRGTVTANGTTGVAYFEYGLTQDYGTTTKAENSVAISGAEINKPITAPDLQFQHGKTYHFRVVFEADAGGAITRGTDMTFVANATPRAVDDKVVTGDRGPTTINVASNDSDPDLDRPSISAVTQPEHGTTKIDTATGRVIYTPNAEFIGFDSFDYTVKDDSNGVASATVTIHNPRLAAAGTRAALLKDAEGKIVGYVQIRAMESGGLTGKMKLGDNSYTVVGRLDAEGRFHGRAVGGNKTRTIDLAVSQEGATAALEVEIDGGWLTGTLPARGETSEQLETLPGRYTIELPSGGTTTTPTPANPSSSDTDTADSVPGGSGWAGIQVFPDGTVRLKGKLGDGRGFSMSGALAPGEESVVLDVYAKPGKKSRLTGTLNFGETIAGSLDWTRRKSGTRLYGDGFDLTVSATGGRYTPPADGERAFGASRGTITLTGGEVGALTHQLRISDDDDVRVSDPGDAELKLKIKRDSGIFTGAFTHPEDERRHKLSGVLLNRTAGGRGVFLGRNTAGKVQLSPGSAGSGGGGSGTGAGPTTGTTVETLNR